MVGSTHVLGPQPPILSVMNTNWDSRSSDYTPHAATGADDAIMISSLQLDLDKKINHGPWSWSMACLILYTPFKKMF